MPQITRRQFLMGAGAVGVLTVPALTLGYDAAMRNTRGEAPPQLSPYALEDELNHISQPPFQRAPLLILLDESAANPFARYYTEILRAEGLNFFTLARTTAVQLSDLQQFNGIL